MAQRTRRAARVTLPLVLILTAAVAVGALGIWFWQQSQKEQQTLVGLHHELGQLTAQNTELQNKQQQALDEEELLSHLAEKTAQEKAACFALIAQLEQKIRAGESDKKIAYLTFDDGPYQQTGGILETLAEKKVRATFFLRNRPEYIETIRAEIAAGHTIANHSYSHKIKRIYQSADTFIRDIEQQQQWLTETFGVTPLIYRFPGGSPTAKGLKGTITAALSQQGLGYVDWNAATGDGLPGSLSTQQAYQNVMKSAEGKSIIVVLMHDYSAATAEALPDIIDSLRERGYLLLPLFRESVMIKSE